MSDNVDVSKSLSGRVKFSKVKIIIVVFFNYMLLEADLKRRFKDC